MPNRPVIVQLTDVHLRDDDPSRALGLAKAIERVAALEPEPLAVLVTGDVCDAGEPASYAEAARQLAALALPVFVIPGNHDDREALRAAFAMSGEPGEPLQWSVDAEPLRIINCDTLVPGQIGGELDIAWLEAELSAAADRPTIVAMHHPPIAIGVSGMDAHGLPEPTRVAFAELMRRSPHVVGVVAGHVHRAALGVAGGVHVATAPSVNLQLALDLVGDRMEVNWDDPPGFLIHVMVGDRLISHVQNL